MSDNLKLARYLKKAGYLILGRLPEDGQAFTAGAGQHFVLSSPCRRVEPVPCFSHGASRVLSAVQVSNVLLRCISPPCRLREAGFQVARATGEAGPPQQERGKPVPLCR